jgi:predicted nucleic acid-binding protein
VEVAAEHQLYAYDAYLIVCALQQRAPLLTLDAALGRAAAAAGVTLHPAMP